MDRDAAHNQSPKNIRILGTRIRGRFGKVRKVCLKIHAFETRFETNGASLDKSINDNYNWLREEKEGHYFPYHEKPYYS